MRDVIFVLLTITLALAVLITSTGRPKTPEWFFQAVLVAVGAIAIFCWGSD